MKFQSLTERIDTNKPTGRAPWRTMVVIADFQRWMFAEHMRVGLKAAHCGALFPY
jgi:hypothetical protein